MFLGHNCWSLFSSKYIGPIILPQPQLHTPLLSTMNNTNKNITRAQKGVAGFLDSLSDFRPPLTLPPLVLHLFISHKRQAWAQFECIHLDNMLLCAFFAGHIHLSLSCILWRMPVFVTACTQFVPKRDGQWKIKIKWNWPLHSPYLKEGMER